MRFFLTVRSIYLTHSIWKILWVLLQVIYDGTNPLVFAKSRKAQLLTEKTCFSENFFVGQSFYQLRCIHKFQTGLVCL